MKELSDQSDVPEPDPEIVEDNFGSEDQHQSLCSKVKQNWTEFCASTGFQGFGYLITASNALELIVWTVVIVVAIGLTFHDISMSVEKYLEEGTTTEVTVIHAQEIKLSPTFCMGLQPTILVPRSVWSNPTRVREILKAVDRPDFIDFIRREAENASTIDDENLQLFVGLASQWITNLVLMENVGGYGLAATNTSEIHYGVIRVKMNSAGGLEFYADSNGSQESIQLVSNFLLSKNASSLAELVRIIGAILCKNMQIEVLCGVIPEGGMWKVSTLSLCHPSRVTWLGLMPFNSQEHFLCLNASDETVLKFKTNTDSCAIRAHPEHMFGTDFPNLRNTITYFDFTGGRAMTKSTTNNVLSSWGNLTTFWVTVLGHYYAIDTKNKHCSNDINMVDCRGACRANWMAKHCGCYPVSWAGLGLKAENMSYCGEVRTEPGTYLIPGLSSESCNPSRWLMDPDPECFAKCHRPCEVYIYNNALRPIDEGFQDIQANDTGILLKFDSFLYPEFEEKLAVDATTLVANLGGNMGLWLGACIVSVVYLFLWVVKFIANILLQVDRGRRRSASRRKSQYNKDTSLQPLNSNKVDHEQTA